MNFMSSTTNKLTEWVIQKIKTEYPDDIALLVAVEGSSINGDGHGEPFDYFIPATDSVQVRTPLPLHPMNKSEPVAHRNYR